jgi:hypothetical protein
MRNRSNCFELVIVLLLASLWQPANKELLKGTSTIEFRFITDEEQLRGVPGVQ